LALPLSLLLLLLLLLLEALLLLELLLLELLELLGVGSLLRGDSLGGLGLSVRGLSGLGFRSSCAFETVEAAALNKSAAPTVKHTILAFSKFDFMWSPPACAAFKTTVQRCPDKKEEFGWVDYSVKRNV
jgi:hypothetical protein